MSNVTPLRFNTLQAIDSRSYHENEINTYFQNGNWQALINYAKALLIDYRAHLQVADRYFLHTKIGLSHLSLSQNEEAVEHFTQALLKTAQLSLVEEFWANYHLSLAHFAAHKACLQDDSESKAELKLAIQNAEIALKSALESEQQNALYLHLSHCLETAGSFSEALFYYKQVNGQPDSERKTKIAELESKLTHSVSIPRLIQQA